MPLLRRVSAVAVAMAVSMFPVLWMLPAATGAAVALGVGGFGGGGGDAGNVTLVRKNNTIDNRR